MERLHYRTCSEPHNCRVPYWYQSGFLGPQKHLICCGHALHSLGCSLPPLFLSFFLFIYFKLPSSAHLSPFQVSRALSLHEALLPSFLVLIGKVCFQVDNSLLVNPFASCPEDFSDFGLLSLLDRDQVLRPHILGSTQLKAWLDARRSRLPGQQ